MTKKHKIRIEAPGHSYLTKIYLDDQELRGVYSVSVTIDPQSDRQPRVTLTLGPSNLLIDGSEVIVDAQLRVADAIVNPDKPQLTQEDDQNDD